MKNRDFSLDFCRVVISAFVIIYHFSCHTTYYYKPLSIILDGAFINFIFFIISGFSLFYKYNRKFSVSKYFFKRARKIYPLFYLMTIIFFLRILIIAPNFLENIPYYSYFLSILGLDGYLSARAGSVGFAGDWFIGLMLLIYLLYPLLCKANKKIPFCTLLILEILYVIWFRFDLINISSIYFPIIFGVLGVYIGMMLNRYKNYIFNKPIVFIFAFVFVAVSCIFDLKYGYFLNTVFYTCAFICIYYIGKLLCKNEFIALLLAFLSKYSYGVLLCQHQIILIILQYFQIINVSSSWLCILSVMSLSFLMSYVCTNTVNKAEKLLCK